MWTLCVLQASPNILRSAILKSVNLLIMGRNDCFACSGIGDRAMVVCAASISLCISWMVIVYVDWLLIQSHQIFCLKVQPRAWLVILSVVLIDDWAF